MIELANLTKQFGTHTALSGLSLSVPKGEVTCLLGANGAGKSTTLNLLLNFIEPDSGTIKIGGLDVTKEPVKSKDKLVYIPELMNLYPEFNAIENLSYLAKLDGLSVSKQQIETALTETGLQPEAWTKPLDGYSKGMRQKVGIAFAVLKQAEVLLLDEPTSGLDPSATLEFINIIEKLAKQGAAILMVTHDLYCAHTLAHQVAILHQGKLKALLNTNDLSLTQLEERYHLEITGQSFTSIATEPAKTA